MRERASPVRVFGSIVVREVVAAKGAFAGWLAPAAIVLVATMSMQRDLAKEGSVLAEKIRLMPEALRLAFGMKQIDLADPAAYVATNFTTTMLIGAVFAGLLGGSILAKEEAQKTSEMLFAAPVSRRLVVLAKACAALGLVLAWDACLCAVAAASFVAFDIDTARLGVVVAIFAGAGLMHVTIAAVAFAVTARSARPRSSASRGLAVVFALYGVGVVAALADGAGALRWLSPFKYAEAIDVALAGGLPARAAALPFIAALAVVLAAMLFERKDLHA